MNFKNKLVEELSSKKYKIYFLDNETKGQADTIFQQLEHFKENESFFINSCDVFSTFNFKEYSKLVKTSDIIVFVSNKSFENLPSNSYTWVEFTKNKFKNVFIKNKPKKNLKILTGNFYFKNKTIYNRCFSHVLDKKLQEIFIDDLIKVSIKLKYNVNVIVDDAYVNLGTPDLIKDFIFWKNFFKNENK